ncbi:hypothetical protein EYF80_012938 [Liparis tanakae]|uniref:Uncharacterized protein n=1 Tax=Liparis tanakae TaxID=230148 RepID=A0A4Z2IGR7_9TELE|nr:hypothetical protein EYF80_012938 [Liparis tanakae]
MGGQWRGCQQCTLGKDGEQPAVKPVTALSKALPLGRRAAARSRGAACRPSAVMVPGAGGFVQAFSRHDAEPGALCRPSAVMTRVPEEDTHAQQTVCIQKIHVAFESPSGRSAVRDDQGGLLNVL